MKTLQPTGVLEGETSPYKHKTFTKTAELADTADYSCKGRKGKVVSVAATFKTLTFFIIIIPGYFWIIVKEMVIQANTSADSRWDDGWKMEAFTELWPEVTKFL